MTAMIVFVIVALALALPGLVGLIFLGFVEVRETGEGKQLGASSLTQPRASTAGSLVRHRAATWAARLRHQPSGRAAEADRDLATVQPVDAPCHWN